ncbi:ferric reductase NAD binding domain-containing protein [Dipodascopsis uninucleata]
MCVQYCEPSVQEGAWNYWDKLCSKAGTILDKSYSEYLAEGMVSYICEQNYTDGANATVPILQNRTDLLLDIHAEDAWDINFYLSSYFGNIYLVYWGVFLITSFIRNVYVRFMKKRGGNNRVNKLWGLIKRYFLVSSLFNGRHLTKIKLGSVAIGVMPLRWQTIMAWGFCSLSVVFLFSGNDFFVGDPYYKNVNRQHVGYIDTRAGHFANIILPQIYFFGSRNNILMVLCNWSFDTFNILHRWTGRWFIIYVALHGWLLSMVTLRNAGQADYIDYFWHTPEIDYGIGAAFVTGFMILSGIYSFRHYFYEIFLWFHIAGSITILPLIYYHIQWGGGDVHYIWATIALWGFDRVVRVCRILYFGVGMKADAKVVGDATYLEVNLSRKYKPQPGQYAFLYVMRHNFWESHPFSVMSERDGKYIFVAKRHHGMTGKLHSRISNASEKSDKVSVWIEGWYGQPYPLDKYDTVLLVAGGIGITAMWFACSTLKAKNISGQRIILYWVVRSGESLKWAEEELKGLSKMGGNSIEINIYVTSQDYTVKDISADPDLSSDQDAENSLNFDIEEGKSKDVIDAIGQANGSKEKDRISINYGEKPHIQHVIHDTASNAPSSVAVFACGPGSLADACRHAVAEISDTYNIDYYEDSFSWA